MRIFYEPNHRQGYKEGGQGSTASGTLLLRSSPMHRLLAGQVRAPKLGQGKGPLWVSVFLACASDQMHGHMHR